MPITVELKLSWHFNTIYVLVFKHWFDEIKFKIPGSAEFEEVALDTRFPEEVRRRVFPVVGRSLITNFGLTLRSCRARYRGKKLAVLRENLKTGRKHFSRKRPKRNSRTVARKKLRCYQKCFRTAVVDDANALELFFTISVCSGGIQLSSSPENSSPANSKALLHFTFNWSWARLSWSLKSLFPNSNIPPLLLAPEFHICCW